MQEFKCTRISRPSLIDCLVCKCTPLVYKGVFSVCSSIYLELHILYSDLSFIQNSCTWSARAQSNLKTLAMNIEHTPWWVGWKEGGIQDKVTGGGYRIR